MNNEVWIDNQAPEHALQGYELLKEDTIKCGGCNKPLVEVIKVKKNDTTTIIKVLCPFCGDTSFKYTINGKIYIQAVEGLSIKNMPTEVKDNIIQTYIEVIKNDNN